MQHSCCSGRFSDPVVTLHRFWAVFPLISFSSEILSSPPSAADGTIYFQGCSQSEGCRQLSGAVWAFATWFYSCRQAWQKRRLHFCSDGAVRASELPFSSFLPRGHCCGRLCLLVFCEFGRKTLKEHSLSFARVLSNALPSPPPNLPQDRHSWTGLERLCCQTFSQIMKQKPREGKRLVGIAQQVSGRGRLAGWAPALLYTSLPR